MPRGNRPKPTHLKLITGNPGNRKLIPEGQLGGTVRAVGDLKTPPSYFDKELRATWRYAIANAPAGLLKKIDLGILAAWCAAYLAHSKAVAEVRRLGILYKPRADAEPQQNPYLAVQNKQALIMARLVVELGFSPRARASVTTDSLPQDNDFAEF